MFRRRGCLFGCGSFVLVCLIVSLLVWFVGVPRTIDWFEDDLSGRISTAIDDSLFGQYSPAQLRQGTEVRLPFANLNTALFEPVETTNDPQQVEHIEITSEGNNLVMRAWFNGQAYDFTYAVSVNDDGTLNLTGLEDKSWLEDRLMEVMEGGLEKSINTWLDLNDLQLVDVWLEGDAMVLSVTER